MAKHYPDVESFFAANEMPVPKTGDWRLLNPFVQGEVNALPQSRGLAIATDGVICFIERNDGSLYRGHFTAFVPDKAERSTSADGKTRSPRVSLASLACFVDF